MIKEFKKSVGYICPHCSTITVRDVNLFDFSGNTACELPCASLVCTHRPVTISAKKDKYAISIHCPICDEKHLYNIRKITFWQKDFLVLHCTESGFGVLFIGDDQKIRAEIKEQERLINELEEDFAVSEELSIIFEAVEHINALARSDSIFCSCGSRNIAIEIYNDRITLLCRDCNLKKEIKTDKKSLEDLLKSSTIVL